MNNQQKMRIFSLFTLLTSCYLLIVIALYRIQLQQHDFFVSLGKQQYNTTETTYPPRAPIFDRTGTTMLAMNNEAISAFITPNNLKDKDTLIDFLHQNFPDAAQKLSHNTTRPFMYIQRELTPQELAVIKKHALPDIQFLHESSRFYPCISAAPLIGITNRENQGVLGLELKYNAHLSGTPTTYMLEKDAHSGHFHRKSIPNVQGEQGKPIITTLDTSLQFLVDQELTQCMQKFSAQAGAVVIVNPDNGEVCALAHQPSFDPNNRRSLDINKTKAFSITESYELGSIIKIFCALAALEEGVVTLEEPINCYNTRTAYIHGRKVNTARGTPAGVISFSEVIEKSNNIGIAQVAHRLGDKLYDHYKRLGFGSKTGIEFPNEQTGFINPPATWSKQSLISLSYGYEITATLLQFARALCIIARDGHDVQLTLIKQTSPPQSPTSPPLYSQKALDDIKEILQNTTLRGTAKKARIKGYTIMSKTGTTNLLINGSYAQNKNAYTCAGIIKKDDYQRVIIAYVKQGNRGGLFGSSVAAPLFERIAEKTIIHDKIV